MGQEFIQGFLKGFIVVLCLFVIVINIFFLFRGGSK